jgi:cell division protease FtsH
MAIDDEIKDIVMTCMKNAEKILHENIDTLHRLSLVLLEREILDSEEIDKIIRGEELPPMKKNGVVEGDEKLSENSEAEIPEHVKKLIEKKKQQDSFNAES